MKFGIARGLLGRLRASEALGNCRACGGTGFQLIESLYVGPIGQREAKWEKIPVACPWCEEGNRT